LVGEDPDRQTYALVGDAPLSASLTNPYNGLPPLQPQDAVLEVRNLSCAYGNIAALHDIYCHFPEKQVTAIMGPSGCGKSTLVKTLNRSLELAPEGHLTAGSVLYRGNDIYDPRGDVMAIRRQIGIIHQRPVIFPLSIVENVLFGAKFHQKIRGMSQTEYAESYLEKVGLLDEIRDRLQDSAGKLSGGQQQRLCLARTLANQPDVILMDEPCSAIDPVSTQRIEELIRELKRDYTIIIVTHNMNQAKRVSDLAVFMLGGRIVEAGETRRFFDQPQTELARSFISGVMG
jgi:phosphate transport system ATP-binding protein